MTQYTATYTSLLSKTPPGVFSCRCKAVHIPHPPHPPPYGRGLRKHKNTKASFYATVKVRQGMLKESIKTPFMSAFRDKREKIWIDCQEWSWDGWGWERRPAGSSLSLSLFPSLPPLSLSQTFYILFYNYLKWMTSWMGICTFMQLL